MITVILPTKNDKAVGRVIDEIKVLPFESNIVVTDYKSTDGTREVVLSMGVTLIDEPLKGKGIAVRNVMKGISEGYILLLDADYTYPAWYLTEILRELHSGADVVVGVRAYRDKNSMTLINRVGNFLLSLLASTLFGYRIRDVCSGMWGFRAEALKGFNLTSNGFTLEVDFFTNAIRNGCRIAQVPIRYRVRLGGSKPKLNTWDGFRIASFLIRRGLACRYLLQRYHGTLMFYLSWVLVLSWLLYLPSYPCLLVGTWSWMEVPTPTGLHGISGGG